MQSGEVSGKSGALLAIEIAAESTSVVLVDRVEDTFRFIARAERPSTHRPPTSDALPAVVQAIGELERLTGRQLLRGETLLKPQQRDGSGVDAVVAASSDIAPLTAVVLTGGRSRAAQQAQAAMRGLSIAVLDTIDQRSADLEQHIAAHRNTGIDVFVVLDPSPAGTTQIMNMLSGVARHARRPMAILCGAEAAPFAGLDGIEIEQVASLADRGGAGVEPLRAALRRRLRELLPVRVPGYRGLQTLDPGAISSVAEDQGLALRFLATQHKRSLLFVGANGGATFAFAAGKRAYAELLDEQLGLRAGAPEVMRRRGVDAIARWLPEKPTTVPGRTGTVPPAALRNRIMNRALRPQLPSVDVDDLLLDAALMREALFDMLPSLGSSRDLPDTLIGGGTLARCPLPALIALALLDLLPAAYGIVELTLDRGMLATAGSLARVDPTAAASLADTGESLATAVLLGQTNPLLPTAAHVELTVEGAQPLSVDVRRGQLVRLPLARGKRAELRVRSNGLAAGSKGAELRRMVSGSTLGIVVDARAERPAVPAGALKRGATIQRWLATLDPTSRG